MSQGINSVTLIGNLGQDPEVRYSQGGTAICNLSVAVNERVKKGEEWQDHVEWFRIVCFGQTAENAAKFLAKGRQVFVEGKGRHKQWKDKDGNDRFGFEVVADRVLFLGGGKEGGASSGNDRPSKAPASTTRKPAQQQNQVEDDLPF